MKKQQQLALSNEQKQANFAIEYEKLCLSNRIDNIRWMLGDYIGTNKPNASQLVDLFLEIERIFLREKEYLEEMDNG